VIVVASQSTSYSGDLVLDIEVAIGIAKEPLYIHSDHHQGQWPEATVTGGKCIAVSLNPMALTIDGSMFLECC
jgi:hypothetical protein